MLAAVQGGLGATRSPSRSPSRSLGGSGADIALALLVVLVVALMIVPLPTWTLDLLLASNLSLSVAILLVVLYVPDAIGIASFPTRLLLTTLLRVALNVASTRLILLQADAGQVIRAFGSFVVRGNYVVGAVVFFILTIVQLVVITRGAERVAEVGARFVLDAMPGKQMAIDAELRAGAIDGNEARLRRRLLSRESQFYGAMDGAMKFVKGDAIATVIIAIVNILGGLAIGALQRGMTVDAALKRYGLLAIGDGLVTQIPALVLSTAAGVLVTRVASEDEGAPLGQELARQLFGVPKAMRAAGVLVLLLAAVPGLPAIPFVAIGALLLVVSAARSKRLALDAKREETEPAALDRAFVPIVAPWTIEVSADLAPLLDDGDSDEGATREGIRSVALSARERIFQELGVPLPSPRVRVADSSRASRQIVVALFEVPARAIAIPKGLGDADAVALVRDAALELLRARAADFLGLAETQQLLDELTQIAPATVRNVVPKPISVSTLAEVLRRLVAERISIRDLRGVLEALSVAPAAEKDPRELAEHVRARMRRAITYALTSDAASLDVILLDGIVEETVRRGVTRGASGAAIALAPHAARDVVASIRRAAGDASAPVILTQPDVRRFVRQLLEIELPNAVVVSYAELLPEIALRPIAKATPT
jgi:type III secretion protein V